MVIDPGLHIMERIMNQWNLEKGSKTYTVNGKCELTFDPTDPDFVETLCNGFAMMEKVCRNSAAVYHKNGQKVFDLLRERDRKCRAIIDDVFGKGTSGRLFGPSDVCASADGLPLWANFFLCIFDEVAQASENEQRQAFPRVLYYLEKYAKTKRQ